jgi:hypothetical protein
LDQALAQVTCRLTGQPTSTMSWQRSTTSSVFRRLKSSRIPSDGQCPFWRTARRFPNYCQADQTSALAVTARSPGTRCPPTNFCDQLVSELRHRDGQTYHRRCMGRGSTGRENWSSTSFTRPLAANFGRDAKFAGLWRRPSVKEYSCPLCARCVIAGSLVT